MKSYSVKTIKKGGCLSYIVSSGQVAAVIDSRLDLIDEYVNFLNKVEIDLKYAIDTHTHADHLSATSSLARLLDAQIVMHDKAFSPRVDKRVGDKGKLSLGDTELIFHHTPGHTPDSMSIQIGDDLFTGDTVLIGGTGRTDFLGGSPESMADSLKKIRSFEGVKTIYPSHDYNDEESCQFDSEVMTNPLLNNRNRQEVIDQLSASRPPLPENMKGIIRFNKKGNVGADTILSADEVSGHIAVGVMVVDVRETDEFDHGHIEGSKLIPLKNVEKHRDELVGQRAILVCASGNRANEAKSRLEKLGINDLRILDKGLISWKKSRLPLKQFSAVMPLERQVRIVAGALVLLGALLSFFVHYHFIWLSAFVGAGLMFAGMTDTCGMAMALQKMPWNKKVDRKTPTSGCGTSIKGTCSIQ